MLLFLIKKFFNHPSYTPEVLDYNQSWKYGFVHKINHKRDMSSHSAKNQ